MYAWNALPQVSGGDGATAGATMRRAPITGRLELDGVMQTLARRRPVFHSEADFQFSFAQIVHSMDPAIQCRLEVPVAKAERGRREFTSTCSAGVRRGPNAHRAQVLRTALQWCDGWQLTPLGVPGRIALLPVDRNAAIEKEGGPLDAMSAGARPEPGMGVPRRRYMARELQGEVREHQYQHDDTGDCDQPTDLQHGPLPWSGRCGSPRSSRARSHYRRQAPNYRRSCLELLTGSRVVRPLRGIPRAAAPQCRDHSDDQRRRRSGSTSTTWPIPSLGRVTATDPSRVSRRPGRLSMSAQGRRPSRPNARKLTTALLRQ